MPKVYFCADVHIGHKNILKHCPWRREKMLAWADEKGVALPLDKDCNVDWLSLMEQWIVDVWNTTVSKKDSVYILGDFSFLSAKENEKLLSKLHGKKYLILGNHDGNVDSLANHFQYIKQIAEFKWKGHEDGDNTICFEMCHYPLRSWNRMQHGTLHIHGHCHNRLSKENFINGLLRVDVGWDSDLANFNLVSPEQIVEYFRQFTDQDNGESFEEYHAKKQNMNAFQRWKERIKNKRKYKKFIHRNEED